MKKSLKDLMNLYSIVTFDAFQFGKQERDPLMDSQGEYSGFILKSSHPTFLRLNWQQRIKPGEPGALHTLILWKF